MTCRRFAPLLLLAVLLASACGGSAEPPSRQTPGATASDGPEAASQADPQGDATAAPVDAARFVFGAVPGRPVIYWIHTDW
jgi:hypothetical protein